MSLVSYYDCVVFSGHTKGKEVAASITHSSVRSEAVTGIDSVEGESASNSVVGQLHAISSEILEVVASDLPQQIQASIIALQERLENQPKSVKLIQEQAAKDVPYWEQWKRIEKECNGFQSPDLQLLLVLGNTSNDVLKHVRCLRKIRWFAVFDTDPDSEAHGLYRVCQKEGGMQLLTEMWVPANILQIKSNELAGKVDWHKVPWLFVNGRREECPEYQPKEFKDWKGKWLSGIGHFLKVLGEKLDPQSPVCCLVLPFDGKYNQFIITLLQRLDEELTSRDMVAKYLIVSPDEKVQQSLSRLLEDSSNYDRVLHYRMPSMVFELGLRTALDLDNSNNNRYRMPTGPLPERQILYLKEYLIPLYDGCENEDLGRNEESMAEDELEAKIKEHQHAFLSGQPISFLSLKYCHDANRDIGQTLQIKIQQLMDRQPVQPSTVVELIHQPGTGGTTIARRVLWNLSNDYVCAIVHRNTRMIQSSDGEDRFIVNVSQRISDLEDMCGRAPLVLLDGDNSAFRHQSLARRISDRLGSLGRKAVILHCLRAKDFSRPSPYSQKVKTELTLKDRYSFQEKYRQLLEVPRCTPSSLTRTFHFPLWAFFDDFKPKLREIVNECIKNLDPLEVKVIRFVALVQRYGGRSVPPLLLYQMYLEQLVPQSDADVASSRVKWANPMYDDIHGLLSDNVHVLLVKSTRKEEGTVTYDLQHILVAEYVLKRVLRGGRGQSDLPFLTDYVEELLDLESLKTLDDSSVSLFEDLFLFNKNGDDNLSFSILLETLRHHQAKTPGRVGAILSKAAEVFQNAKFFSQAARFHTYADPPRFDLAQKLIARAFEVCKACESKYTLWDTKGLVYRIQLQWGVEKREVTSLKQLETMANNSLHSYNRAITSPPSWPNPIIGRVQVWLACIDWILINECGGDVSTLITYLATKAPPFFKTCLSECFHMIDMVEHLIVSQSLQDVEHTRKLANECRIQLCFLKSKKRGVVTKNVKYNLESLVKLCDDICNNPRVIVNNSSRKELLRLQVYFWLNRATGVIPDCARGLKLDWFPRSRGDPSHLIKLLLQLVEVEHDINFIPILLRVATYLQPDQTLSIEKGIQLASVWQSKNQFDPRPYFFCFMFYFIQIVVEDRVVDYGAKYLQALEKCRQLSATYINTYVSNYYLGKESGLSCLVDKQRLDMQSKDDRQLNEFWKQTSRQKLRELKGRLKVRTDQRKRQKPYIELIQGQLEIFVGKNQEVGDPGRDFQEDQLVTFVVSFHLRGPVAHGITLL